MMDSTIICLKMTDRSIIFLSLVVLHCSFLNGKTCKWKLVEEWHPQPSTYVVNWTIKGNICMDFYRDCWVLAVNTKINTSSNQLVPQICPLQIQLGDILVISSEPSLQSPEINLMNVSKEAFTDCLQNTSTENQLLFGCKLKGMHIVNPHWLSVGTHYFITVMAGGPSLCQLGLRLNVTVKQQFCQESQSSEFCSGHGKCLSEVWDKTYSCRCQPPFSGKYCQELDACSYKPCKNNGSCIIIRGEWNKQGYECICQPPFTGPSCEELMKPCVSHSCWKVGICQNTSLAYISECPEVFLSQNWETDVKECSTPHQNCSGSINITNDVMCTYSSIFIIVLCKRTQSSHQICPWMNNATGTCMKCEKENFSCMPGFTGENCEKVIDRCRLLSISCLNEGWCFNIIGRFRNVCTPECPKNSSWFVKKVYLIHQQPCYCGTTCRDFYPAESASQVGYVWQLQFTESEAGKCKVAIDAYFFLTGNWNEGAVYVNKPEGMNNMCEFPCESTIKICANGHSLLSNEDRRGYMCPYVLRWAGKMYLRNTTGYQENGCQHELICKDEINKPRCSCSLSYIGRFCIANCEYCLEIQSTSLHRLCLSHLHNCNCSCLQRYERNICEIETEDCKSVPCTNGASSIHLSGPFFCKCVPGFTGDAARVFARCWILDLGFLVLPN